MLNYLILFLLPFHLVSISLSSTISINLLEILLLTGIILNFYKIFKITNTIKLKNLFLKNTKNLLPLVMIIIGFTASYVLNQLTLHWLSWSDGLGKLIDLIILPILYGLSLAILIKFKKVFFSKLLHTYFLSAFSISMLGLFYFFNNWLTFDHRLSLFFQSPNQLAIFIVPAILINSVFLLKIKKEKNTTSKYKIIFHFLSLLILLFNLWQTYSLGAWLALSFSIIFLLFTYHLVANTIIFTKIISRYFLPLLFFMFISSILFIINIDIFLSFSDYHPKTPTNSNDSRLAIYQVDQKIVSENWLIGIGPGNFQNIYLDNQKYFPAYPQWAVPHGHNNLIHFWIEGGLLAAIGFLLLTYKIFIPKKQFLKEKQILPTSMFVYFIIHGLVDVTIWTSSSALLFFLITIYTIITQD